jgi:hypothetical protein
MGDQAPQIGSVARHGNAFTPGHRAGRGHLVVVAVLAHLDRTREQDQAAPMAFGGQDRADPGMRDDHPGPVDQRLELERG